MNNDIIEIGGEKNSTLESDILEEVIRKEPEKKEKVEEGEADTRETHFSIIMDILNNIGSKEAISVYNLWLEPLEENILIQKEWLLNSNKYEIVFGEYDEPKHQKRGIFRHNLIKGGHIGIFGNAACGKSTFLQTCLYSFIKKENPAIINIYIIDYSNRLLAQFQNSHMVPAFDCSVRVKFNLITAHISKCICSFSISF